MLSILIPVKNFDCCALVTELHNQGEALDCPYEILIAEDGTESGFLKLNEVADTFSNCRRIVKKENIGRAGIRNILAAEAKFPYLIFIDCDAVVEKKDFLTTYATALKGHQVVCGGLYHADSLHDKRCTLRYKYEKKADMTRDAQTRNKAPYSNFTSFNFAIHKELFNSILFDTSITRYGYEDVLFGKELEKRGAGIIHIENRLLHNGLEENATFLKKTEQALNTLSEIQDKVGCTPLLDTVKKIEKLHLKQLFMKYWSANRKRLKNNLLGDTPSLFKFSIYKLGYYISLNSRQ
jgi:glycosyltransferase involved in cell wall biosynthesis